VPPFRILRLADHLSYGGVIHGPARMFLNTLPRFDPERFRVTLCMLRPRDTVTPLFERRGIRILHLGRHKFDPRTLGDVVRVTRAEGSDLIHAAGYGSCNFGRLAGLALGLPVILHAHDVDQNYPWYQQAVDRLLRRTAVRTLAVSEAVREACVRNRGIPPGTVVVLPNAVDLEDFSPRPREAAEGAAVRLGVPADAPVVGVVARLRKEKGIDTLLDAMPRVLEACPAAWLVLVGDGPQRGALEAQARRLGVAGRVVFAGYQERVPEVMAAFAVKVLPSPVEPFGNVILEAMAMGKPVVASDAGGAREILEQGRTGLLVPPSDPAALADAIVGLLRDPAARRRIGAAALEASRAYGLDAYVERLSAIYEEVLGASSRRRKAAA
jgi:glycosyltransferase involved in cell wall biosynthesis